MEVIHPIGTKVRFKQSGREDYIRELQADPLEVRYAIGGSCWVYAGEFDVIAPPTPEVIVRLQLDYYGGSEPDDE